MQLTFLFTFEHRNYEVLCCYTVPYSYSEMQSHIDHIKLLSKTYS